MQLIEHGVTVAARSAGVLPHRCSCGEEFPTHSHLMIHRVRAYRDQAMRALAIVNESLAGASALGS